MRNWKSTLIPLNATIREAMRSLDKESLRICMLVDNENKLLGTITDGDIRRALLADSNMEDAANLVMNVQPITADINSSREQRLQLMSEYDLNAIPIVDTNKKVYGLETLHQAIVVEKRENPVFIMAGGFGTRLKPFTDHCPKPMLRVGDKPMLERLINQFKMHGFKNFYISTHYLPEVIRDYFKDGKAWGVNIQYIHEEKPLGTGGALGLLPNDLIDLPIIMVNGDVLTKLNYAQILQHHIDNNFDATVCVREDEHRVPFGVIETENQLIINMVEKPTYHYKINTGIYVISSEIVKSVEVDQRIDLPTLLEQHRENNKRIGTFTSYDYWLDIGQMKDYQKAQKDIEIYFK
ncbi:nucleotidyltransferase family protein [Suttonella sp. R2A3]|uniref:nucleotidyltransferase family protein n=1 Tax=Suttonella sp. R2A3 TaxID=2908648 RepID=UPI001F2C2E61|nr:nucleotidyltransferase family protein [Suttonella sp. R2A3]UJF25320.1 nucleotidyltransferase family protein [Suttonella sp. R2A3]